jgi:nitroimidazol reductase NimA-like FMN-containing flavoprotein (pyridoxamine 5'-phosphate oxidase superfamily)
MQQADPLTELDTRFSSSDAAATEWSEARRELENAEVFWLSTVRPGGGPHVTPLIALWLEDALYFCTGPAERKAKNLSRNAHCALTTGCNTLGSGLDVVVEGNAAQVTDEERLRRIAAAYESKYGSDWRFTVRDGVFVHGADEASTAVVYEVAPRKAFGFRKGEEFSQTRWLFDVD